MLTNLKYLCWVIQNAGAHIFLEPSGVNNHVDALFSVGRISNETVENYTHAVFMRFQRKEDVAKFYENPFYLKVLKEHVMPYCHVCPAM